MLSYASFTPNAWKIGITLVGNKRESQEQLWECLVAISILSLEKGNETEGVNILYHIFCKIITLDMHLMYYILIHTEEVVLCLW